MLIRRLCFVLLGTGLAGLAAVGPAAVKAQQTAGRGSLPTEVVHYDPATLSRPSYRVRMEHNVRVPMRDGVTLSADI